MITAFEQRISAQKFSKIARLIGIPDKFDSGRDCYIGLLDLACNRYAGQSTNKELKSEFGRELVRRACAFYNRDGASFNELYNMAGHALRYCKDLPSLYVDLLEMAVGKADNLERISALTEACAPMRELWAKRKWDKPTKERFAKLVDNLEFLADKMEAELRNGNGGGLSKM